jgi:hypothetical protein
LPNKNGDHCVSNYLIAGVTSEALAPKTSISSVAWEDESTVLEGGMLIVPAHVLGEHSPNPTGYQNDNASASEE